MIHVAVLCRIARCHGAALAAAVAATSSAAEVAAAAAMTTTALVSSMLLSRSFTHQYYKSHKFCNITQASEQQART